MYLYCYIKYLAKTSADNTQPIILPRCGTLLTYGSAEVTRIFVAPLTGILK